MTWLAIPARVPTQKAADQRHRDHYRNENLLIRSPSADIRAAVCARCTASIMRASAVSSQPRDAHDQQAVEIHRPA